MRGPGRHRACTSMATKLERAGSATERRVRAGRPPPSRPARRGGAREVSVMPTERVASAWWGRLQAGRVRRAAARQHRRPLGRVQPLRRRLPRRSVSRRSAACASATRSTRRRSASGASRATPTSTGCCTTCRPACARPTGELPGVDESLDGQRKFMLQQDPPDAHASAAPRERAFTPRGDRGAARDDRAGRRRVPRPRRRRAARWT